MAATELNREGKLYFGGKNNFLKGNIKRLIK
jgi:hypothetical protein